MNTLKASFLTAVCLLIITASYSQTKLIEKVERKEGEIVIPYEKYQLDNGLTLIIHEDNSDPLVHVDVTYHVGSAREELKKSGFAHFFEHMMFQGSDNVADEEHFKIVSESGGTLNGTTNRDRTNYFETLPKNQLETALWLEADRMGFLLNAVTQKKFEVQRETVKNEKGQNYDNSPYGKWRELNASTLYPYGHPYSWLTIGILEDLDRVNVDDLKKFFLRWYGPNNATLTVGGDVNSKDVIAKVEKYFGDIPKGPEVTPLKLDPVVLDKDRYVSYYDKNIRFPALLMTYPTVPRFHPDEPALDCLGEILGTGKGSYFYKTFVKTQAAIQASVFHNTSELAGEFTMFVLPFPGKSLSDFETEMRQALDEFEKNGVTDEDIQKFKARYESQTINALATVSGKVSQLAAYETFSGNPNYLKKELESYLAVTKKDVIRVYNQYVKGKYAVVQSVIAKEDGAPAKPDNFSPQTEGNNPFPVTDYSGLTYQKGESDFDRSKRPVPGQSPLVSVPEVWNATTKSGIKVIGTKSSEIPTVAIELTIYGGHKLEASNFEKAGVAQLTAAMLNESTENYSSQALSEELQKLGSSISVSSGSNSTVLSVRTLTKNLDATIALAEEVLKRPKFLQEDFDRIKKQQLEGIKSQEKQPVPIANNVYRRLLYGDEHIYSVPSSGIEETVQNITLEDVKNFYKSYYSPTVAELVIVGDVDKKEIMRKLSFLDNWEAQKVTIPEMKTNGAIDKTKIYLVNKEKAPQSEIRIGYLTDMKYDATGEYFERSLMNYNLGGAFNSRINLNLREDKGYTYGARSSFSGGDENGPFTASAGVRANVTDSAVAEFMKEIKLYADKGIEEDELSFMKNSIGQRDARSYEAPWQKTSFLRRILHYDLSTNYVKEQNKIINTITVSRINELARKHLPYEKMNIVVVGDKESLAPGLAALGYEIVEVDTKGNIIEEGAKIDTSK
ncbi:insulinase family protein [Fulvivirga sp. M361]|uniref:M16 family metallopeptidase n=1 Tax=Fulvivirga sp. M361 TaxID=2594266 RepID=UPI00117A8C76|nr:pitrilysin family protein [Fulvivirga sp. M361]TRX48787.1 insulinase family protein [Fulvivirga sp. M361]